MKQDNSKGKERLMKEYIRSCIEFEIEKAGTNHLQGERRSSNWVCPVFVSQETIPT